MVRKELLTILTLVLFATNGLYAVPDKIFTSSGHILPGEEYSNVYIYNDGTIVNMIGGDIDSMGTYDASMLNVTGGHVSTLDALEFSTANISGGTVGGAHALDHAVVNFSGTATAGSLGAGSDFGTVNMSGGVTQYLGAGDSGTINLYGGVIAECLGASGESIANIYGYGFNYDPTAGSRDGGQLTGFWFDDTPFTIDLSGEQTYSHINIVPEPASILLLSLGGLFLRKK